jgi:hypothetical protein
MVKLLLVLMFIFPLNKLRCWEPGRFDSLMTAVRPLPGILAALSKGPAAKQPSTLPSWQPLVALNTCQMA